MVNFGFYTDRFHGDVIPPDAWEYYASRAEDQLKRYKRIYRVTEPEQDAESMAVCAMAEALHNIDTVASGAGAVSSASIGSVSVSYSTGAEKAVDVSPRGQARELYRVASLYLDICRGVS